jgi:hypothetical protein
MPKHILVKPKYRQLIMHWNIIFGIFLVLSSCNDLVKESDADADACNSAIDNRNYDTALTACTSRKDKASAYMGKAGYDIINLIKSSGTPVPKFTTPTALGTDDVAGASILNILQLSRDVIANYETRAAAISSSRTNLDSASALLQPSLGDNSSDPLDTDEILLNTFAISFAMQLFQLEIFDNKTTSTSTFPSGSANNLSCTQVTNYDSADAKAVLVAMDGHLWTSERDGMQCTRIRSAMLAIPPDNQTAVLDNFTNRGVNGGLLPLDIRNTVCAPFDSLTTYLSHLALNLTELKKAISLSGDNTKAITNADNSTNTLMKTVGCKE